MPGTFIPAGPYVPEGNSGEGTTDHRDLSHRNDPTQHSIGSVTGLSAALAAKAPTYTSELGDPPNSPSEGQTWLPPDLGILLSFRPALSEDDDPVWTNGPVTVDLGGNILTSILGVENDGDSGDQLFVTTNGETWPLRPSDGAPEPWPLLLGEGMDIFVTPPEELHTRGELDDLDLLLWPDSASGLFYQNGRLSFSAYGANGSSYRTTVDGDDWAATPRSLDISVEPAGYKGAAGGAMLPASGSTFGQILHMERADDVTGNEYHEFGVAKYLNDDDESPTYLGLIWSPNLDFADRADAEDSFSAANGSGQIVRQGDYYVLLTAECAANGEALYQITKARCSVADWVAAIDADEAPVFSKWDGMGWATPALGGLAAGLFPSAAFPSRGDIIELGDQAGYLLVWADPEADVDGLDWTLYFSTTTDLLTFTDREAIEGPSDHIEWYSLKLYSGHPSTPNVASTLPIHLIRTNAEDAGDRWATAGIERVYLYPHLRLSDDSTPTATEDVVRILEDRPLTNATTFGGDPLDAATVLDPNPGPVELVFDGVSSFAGGFYFMPSLGRPPVTAIIGVELDIELADWDDSADVAVSITLSAGGPNFDGSSSGTGWSTDEAKASLSLVSGDPSPARTVVRLNVDEPLTTEDAAKFLGCVIAVIGGAPVPPTSITIHSVRWIYNEDLLTAALVGESRYLRNRIVSIGADDILDSDECIGCDTTAGSVTLNPVNFTQIGRSVTIDNIGSVANAAIFAGTVSGIVNPIIASGGSLTVYRGPEGYRSH